MRTKIRSRSLAEKGKGVGQNVTTVKDSTTNLLIAIVLGGKEGQGPKQKNSKHQKSRKHEEVTSSANVASHSEMSNMGGTMFVFSVTSSFHCVATKLGIPPE